MPLTITDPSEEPTVQEYINGKNKVKGAVKSVSVALSNLQAMQTQFNEFLTANPNYAFYYGESVSSIPTLTDEFNHLNQLAADWIATVERIKLVNPLF